MHSMTNDLDMGQVTTTTMRNVHVLSYSPSLCNEDVFHVGGIKMWLTLYWDYLSTEPRISMCLRYVF